MSLIENMMTPCILMEKTRVPDGQGGLSSTWVEGEEIMVAIVKETSMAARVAEQDGVTSTYTLTTNKNVRLDFHDVIKRKSDGKIFRVTSDAKDMESPAFSPILNMAQVTAEKWVLTT